MLICRISARRSASICGRPPQGSGFPTPVPAEAGTMPTHEGLGPNDRNRLQDRRKPSIQLDEEQPIAICEFEATSDLPPQHSQLMPEHCVLRLKSALRLERRGEQRQARSITARPSSLTISNSITKSIRMEFSVHTAQQKRGPPPARRHQAPLRVDQAIAAAFQKPNDRARFQDVEKLAKSPLSGQRCRPDRHLPELRFGGVKALVSPSYNVSDLPIANTHPTIATAQVAAPPTIATAQVAAPPTIATAPIAAPSAPPILPKTVQWVIRFDIAVSSR